MECNIDSFNLADWTYITSLKGGEKVLKIDIGQDRCSEC